MILTADPKCAKAQNNLGQTPLHLAVLLGNIDVINELLKAHGDSLLNRNINDNTPVNCAL
jgi:ankyrin repeat protein